MKFFWDFMKGNRAMLDEINRAAEFLAVHDKIRLFCHLSPDGDTLGGAFAIFYALRSMGKKCCVECGDDLPQKFQYMYPDQMGDFKPEYNVTVDVADIGLLSDSQQKLKFYLCIDHHERNNIPAEYKCVDSKAAAVCELVYLILKQMNVNFTSKIADCLYTGICTDTGCFKFSNVRAITHKIAAELMEFGADAHKINFQMFTQKSVARLELERLVIENLEYFYDNKCTIVFVTNDMMRSAGASESTFDGVAAIAVCPEGVEVGITVKEKDINEYKVSVRTNSFVDASEFCGHFGGGGHKRAAGFKINGDMQTVKNKILDKLKKEIFF